MSGFPVRLWYRNYGGRDEIMVDASPEATHIYVRWIPFQPVNRRDHCSMGRSVEVTLNRRR
jgi:hypothetical protein